MLSRCTPNWWEDTLGNQVKSDGHYNHLLDKYHDKKPMLVDFYLENCGWCEKMQDDWNKLYKKLHKKVKFLKADGRKLDYFTDYYCITSYPKIMLVLPDGTDIIYEGKRKYKYMKKWLIKNLKKYYEK